MHHRVGLLLSAVILTLLAMSTTVRADDYRDYHDHDYRDVRLYGGLGLGFGGNAKLDASGPFGFFPGRGKDDQVTSIGGQFGVDVPVLRYLSLGGEARLIAWNTDTFDRNNVNRSKLLDLDFKPRLRFPLRNAPLEFYFTVPVGLTVPFLADNFGDNANANSKVGWNIGVGGGVNWWLGRAFALNVEPVFVIHKFSVDGPGGTNADITLRQFTLFFNAVFAI